MKKIIHQTVHAYQEKEVGRAKESKSLIFHNSLTATQNCEWITHILNSVIVFDKFQSRLLHKSLILTIIFYFHNNIYLFIVKI